MPDPDDTATAKLYSQEFYEMIGAVVAPDGRAVVQAGSPFFAPDSYWCVVATLEAAGWTVAPYHVDVPSFGDWGYVLARRGQIPELSVTPPPGGLRFLDDSTLAAAATFLPTGAAAPSTSRRCCTPSSPTTWPADGVSGDMTTHPEPHT